MDIAFARAIAEENINVEYSDDAWFVAGDLAYTNGIFDKMKSLLGTVLGRGWDEPEELDPPAQVNGQGVSGAPNPNPTQDEDPMEPARRPDENKESVVPESESSNPAKQYPTLDKLQNLPEGTHIRDEDVDKVKQEVPTLRSQVRSANARVEKLQAIIELEVEVLARDARQAKAENEAAVAEGAMEEAEAEDEEEEYEEPIASEVLCQQLLDILLGQRSDPGQQ